MSKITREDIFDDTYIEFVEKMHSLRHSTDTKIRTIFWRGVFLGAGVMGFIVSVLIAVFK